MSAGVHRLPPRRTGLRLWTMRFLGLLATGVLLGVGATAIVTFVPNGDGEATLVEGAPAATPGASSEPAADTRASKPKLTRAQRRARAAAVGTLRDLGYRPVSLADYRPKNRLRVLIGRGEGGQRAFFFVEGRYIGNDAVDDSRRIRVDRAGNRSVAISYSVFKVGDKPCCPTGAKARVLFRWDGEGLAPQTAIPPSSERRAPAA